MSPKPIVDHARRIEIVFKDHTLVVDYPLSVEFETRRYADPFHFPHSGMVEARITFAEDNLKEYGNREYGRPVIPEVNSQIYKRYCNWCNEDISMLPDDSNNCCYCGGPLNEEGEPEGATKAAPEALILPAPVPSPGDEKVPLATLSLEEEIDEIIQRKKEDFYNLDKYKIPFGRFDPKTGTYKADVYDNDEDYLPRS